MTLFALLYHWLTRRATARDLAYSNIAFFETAAKPRAAGFRVRSKRFGSSRSRCVVLAVSGPHLTLAVPARDGSVFVCIDTSGSMQSTDVSPTRAQAAKAAARAFINESAAGYKDRHHCV